MAIKKNFGVQRASTLHKSQHARLCCSRARFRGQRPGSSTRRELRGLRSPERRAPCANTARPQPQKSRDAQTSQRRWKWRDQRKRGPHLVLPESAGGKPRAAPRSGHLGQRFAATLWTTAPSVFATSTPTCKTARASGVGCLLPRGPPTPSHKQGEALERAHTRHLQDVDDPEVVHGGPLDVGGLPPSHRRLQHAVPSRREEGRGDAVPLVVHLVNQNRRSTSAGLVDSAPPDWASWAGPRPPALTPIRSE
jgi:hypothetical protein